jgi:hypothetical protein
MDTFEKKGTEVFIIMKNNSSKVSFTTDCWTSPNNIAFMGVTVHYIDENWTMLRAGFVAKDRVLE